MQQLDENNVAHVFSFLDFGSLQSVACTTKHFRQVVFAEQYDAIMWRPVFEEELYGRSIVTQDLPRGASRAVVSKSKEEETKSCEDEVSWSYRVQLMKWKRGISKISSIIQTPTFIMRCRHGKYARWVLYKYSDGDERLVKGTEYAFATMFLAAFHYVYTGCNGGKEDGFGLSFDARFCGRDRASRNVEENNSDWKGFTERQAAAFQVLDKIVRLSPNKVQFAREVRGFHELLRVEHSVGDNEEEKERPVTMEADLWAKGLAYSHKKIFAEMTSFFEGRLKIETLLALIWNIGGVKVRGGFGGLLNKDRRMHVRVRMCLGELNDWVRGRSDYPRYIRHHGP